MFSGNEKIQEIDIDIMCDFILEAGRNHIRWNANYKGNFVKSLMLDMVRQKVPHHIKQAILQSA